MPDTKAAIVQKGLREGKSISQLTRELLVRCGGMRKPDAEAVVKLCNSARTLITKTKKEAKEAPSKKRRSR